MVVVVEYFVVLLHLVVVAVEKYSFLISNTSVFILRRFAKKL